MTMVLYNEKDYADTKRAITVRIVAAALILAATVYLDIWMKFCR